MYSGESSTISAPLNAKGSWNGRWNVTTLSGYTAWQVIITGTSSGAVTYTGSGLYSGATTQQSNDGIFVLTSATNPSSSDFTPSVVDGCCTDPTVTVDNTRKVVKVVYTDYTATVGFLGNTPEGLGYPSATARATYQSAIETFNASEKTSSNLSTLNTALNTFKNTNDIDLPEVGKIYTIQSYVKSPSKTAYLENKSDALTISTDASATVLENLWIVRKSGDKVVLQSAADQDKYIIYSNPGLSTTGSDWTLSKGTEWPYISMYNASLGGGRYVACNPTNGYFGTVVAGQNYYAGSKTQSSDWSTDFKFVESNEYALYSIVFSNIPSGTPTVTYEETEYSNGTDLIAPISLTTASLTVTEIDGYTSDVSIIGNTITVRYFYNISESRTFADTWNYNSEAWTALASDEVPASIADDHDPQYTYYYKQTPIRITTGSNRTITTRFKYSSGGYRMDIAGVDLINASTGKVAYSDYHEGYSGSKHVKQAYALPTVAPGYYYIRYISFGEGNSSEKLTNSQGDIYVCVSPEVGFYRIKGYSNNYITSNTVGSNASMSGTASANNIIYYSKDKNIIFYGTGYGLYKTHTVAPISSTLNAYYFSTGYNGNYCITSNLDDTNGTYCYDNTSNGMKLDRNTNPITSDNYQTDWTLEEVTSLPVTLSNIEGHGFASFYTPVGISSLPDGVKAYIASVDGDRIRFTNITDIPANTGVILYQPTYTEGAVNLTIGDASSSTTGNVLNGIVASTPLATVKTDLSATNILTMQNDGTKGLGFYRYDGTNLNGFRVFVDSNDAVGVKSFVFDFDDDDATGIVSLLEKTKEGTAIYNIAGQRLSKMQKGINIVNGKKILK